MSDFDIIQKAVKSQIAKMTKDSSTLFVVDADNDALWDLYLKSFPEGTDLIYRTRTEHDCSSCRHFIKNFGNVVSIKNNVITTIWDVGSEISGTKYEPVVNALASYIRACPVINVLAIDTPKIGSEKSREIDEQGTVFTWDHFYAELPSQMVNCNRDTKDTMLGRARDLRNVFKRSLAEISNDAVDSVLELISQNSLYKGEEWKTVLESFKKYQIEYNKLDDDKKSNYLWEQSTKVGPVIGKIRNHSIGVLLVDLSSQIDLDEAVRRYESMVAPTNYRRPKAIFTKKMLEDAEKTIMDLGYLKSLGRRYARIEDITINNILFANRDIVPSLGVSNVFKEMKDSIAINPKVFGKVEEISISKFVSDVLPMAKTVEVLLENKHTGNLVSLIAPADVGSPSIFKWNNGFSWAYSGNISDSMKQRVKSLGGDVSGVLRFSIQWNDNHDNENDFDAHCIEPTRNEIYFGNKGRRHISSGMLDVDIINPSRQTKDGIAVENITWSDERSMPEGTYQMFVHNYNHSGGRSGFSAEIEFDGNLYTFSYPKELRQDEKVPVANVTYSKVSGFTIKELIPSALSSRQMWGLDSGQFYQVSLLMMSPNYWDDQESNGNKHYFLMIKDCINPEQPNGFFNEYLRNELITHKRVFEALGSKMRVEPNESQLSGLGFSSTQHNELIVRVTGNVERTLKVVF